MRRSGTAMVAAMTIGGLLVAGCGGKSTSATPAGPADVTVHGLDSLKFDQASYSAKAGSIVIELVNDGANPHSLVIDKVSSFKKLNVSGSGAHAQGTATLDPGTYAIYCDIPGHRSAGMEAKLVVN